MAELKLDIGRPRASGELETFKHRHPGIQASVVSFLHLAGERDRRAEQSPP
jgi:hypothetical protein